MQPISMEIYGSPNDGVLGDDEADRGVWGLREHRYRSPGWIPASQIELSAGR
ncbi:MAG: hypothetical protein WA997_04905 [Anaerolineales bacterium]